MLERGFKSWSERISLELRKDLQLSDTAPLDARALADYLEVAIWDPRDLDALSSETLDTLLIEDRDNWSAVTVSHNGSSAILRNPSHSGGRPASDIMHELGHLIIGHDPSRMILSQDGSIVLRSFDQRQEQEATWLAGCLLLPRPALLGILATSLSGEAACQKYGVSSELLTYRRNVTGVTRQMKRRKPRAKKRAQTPRA